MHKKDYLQRRLEEFGKALALIMGHKQQSDWDKFEQEIAAAAQKFTGLEIDAAERMSGEDFETKILRNEDLAQEQKKILATLLFERLSFYLGQKNEESSAALTAKCLAIYRHLKDNFTDNEFDLDVHYKLNFLNNLQV